MATRKRARLPKVLTLVAAFLAIVLAMASFSLFGPPSSWGADLENAALTFSADSSPATREALAGAAADTAPSYLYAELHGPYGVPGKPVFLDRRDDTGEAVLITSGATWTRNQNLYWRRAAGARWTQVRIPDGFVVSNPRLVQWGGRAALLIERWNPWFPFTSSYGRFVRSITNRELRAEYGIYVLDLASGAARFLYPGQDPVLSPDRRLVAYVSSTHHGFSAGGFHTIHIRELDTGRRSVVMSLWEIDPGSGKSFGYAWTRDSRSLLIHGSTSGVGRSAVPPRGNFRALYTLDPRALHLLE